MEKPRAFLKGLFQVAVNAALPDRSVAAYLPAKPKGRTIVIGAGKGAAQLAQAIETHWDGPLSGIVVTRYGYGATTKQIEMIEASHPVPDAAGLAAAKRLQETVAGLTRDDLVIALICGGGSALLPCPPGGISLNDEIAMNEALLASGAPISAMNTLRKHVSNIKGGRLAALASPAKVVTLIVSDIPGDIAAFVASGPTVPDGSSRQDALDVVARYGLYLPDTIIKHLNSAAADAPDPNDTRFAGNEVHIIASASVSLEAAQRAAEAQGIPTVILSDSIEGEARESAKMHAAIAREINRNDRPFAKPVLLLSGGETTVTLCGNGKGGRNSEFLLAFALEIDGIDGIICLAADTDGIDGSEDNAGGIVDSNTVNRLRQAGIDPLTLLANNDAWSALHASDDLFITGPTGTNVNDFRAILVR
ncbi:MAG: glycerate kinase [Rhodobacteraceae bacterium]|nr:glycerate kinase [Paracoccaceae bacterium]